MTEKLIDRHEKDVLLSIENLTVAVQDAEGEFTAVNGVSFRVHEGEIVGIVGESGCGKSLTCLSIPDLLARDVRIMGGTICFAGIDLRKAGEEKLCRLRGDDISMIFQEPMTSLNPLIRVGQQAAESLVIHGNLTVQENKKTVLDIFRRVELDEPERVYNAYPHQLSGGMLQRVMIAMAVVCSPRLLIADEPTTALDVTIQHQILSLLRDLNEVSGLSILFVSHNLAVIHEICQRVIIMYAGRIVEEGRVNDIFYRPMHPYTKGLLGSIPSKDKKGKLLENIEGRVPSLKDIPGGCPFSPRCTRALGGMCERVFPEKTDLGGGHAIWCHHPGDRNGVSI